MPDGWVLTENGRAGMDFGGDAEAAVSAYLAGLFEFPSARLYSDGVMMVPCGACGATGEVEWDWDDPETESVVRARATCPACEGCRVVPAAPRA